MVQSAAARRLLNKLRTCVVLLSNSPRGTVMLREQQWMCIARKIAESMSADEKTTEEPPDWLDESLVAAMSKQYIDSGSCCITPKVESSAPGPSFKKLRAIDNFIVDRRALLRVAAVAMPNVTGASIDSIIKRLAVQMFKELPICEQEAYEQKAEDPTDRVRNQLGRFESQPRDEASLLALLRLPEPPAADAAAAAPSTSVTPKKRRHSRAVADFGQAVLDVSQEFFKGDTPQKLRGRSGSRWVVRQVLSQALEKSTASRKCRNFMKVPFIRKKIRLSRMAVWRKPSGGGRPMKATDKQLVAGLAEHAKTTSRPSARVGEPLRVLDGSLRGCHRADDGLQSLSSYRTLSRRLRLSRPRLGFGKMRKRVDLCPICTCYDLKVRILIDRSVQKHREGLAAILPQYFDHGAAGTLDVSVTTGDDLNRSLLSMRNFCLHAAPNQEDLRMGLTGHALGLLEAQEKEAIADLEDHLDENTEYSRHFAIRDSLRSHYNDHKNNPEPNTLYILSDYKAARPDRFLC
jgi:hypothetical protein